jgi:hypothetical protein
LGLQNHLKTTNIDLVGVQGTKLLRFHVTNMLKQHLHLALALALELDRNEKKRNQISLAIFKLYSSIKVRSMLKGLKKIDLIKEIVMLLCVGIS